MRLKYCQSILLVLGSIMSATAAHALTPELSQAHTIHDVHNVEDLTVINSHWVVGSGLPDLKGKGHLYLFNTADKRAQDIRKDIKVAPDAKSFPACTTPPDFSRMATHGLDYDARNHLLYVVAHNSREAVEVFHVGNTDGTPQFTWKGCIPSPKGTYVDAVAAINDGQVVLSDISDLTQSSNKHKIASGQPVGGVYIWSAKGIHNLPGADKISGPNGVIATRDGRDIYVVATGTRQVFHFTKSGSSYTSSHVDIPFTPDNIRWTPDNKMIFVGGQGASFNEVVACNERKTPYCTSVPTRLDIMNPKTLKLTPVLPNKGYKGVTSGTGAVIANHELWISSTKSDHIVVIPLK